MGAINAWRQIGRQRRDRLGLPIPNKPYGVFGIIRLMGSALANKISPDKSLIPPVLNIYNNIVPAAVTPQGLIFNSMIDSSSRDGSAKKSFEDFLSLFSGHLKVRAKENHRPLYFSMEDAIKIYDFICENNRRANVPPLQTMLNHLEATRIIELVPIELIDSKDRQYPYRFFNQQVLIAEVRGKILAVLRQVNTLHDLVKLVVKYGGYLDRNFALYLRDPKTEKILLVGRSRDIGKKETSPYYPDWITPAELLMKKKEKRKGDPSVNQTSWDAFNGETLGTVLDEYVQGKRRRVDEGPFVNQESILNDKDFYEIPPGITNGELKEFLRYLVGCLSPSTKTPREASNAIFHSPVYSEEFVGGEARKTDVVGFMNINGRRETYTSKENLPFSPLYGPDEDPVKIKKDLGALGTEIADAICKVVGNKGVQELWETEEARLLEKRRITAEYPQTVRLTQELTQPILEAQLYRRLRKIASYRSRGKFKGKDGSQLKANLLLLEHPHKTVPSELIGLFCSELKRISKRAWGDSPENPVSGYTDDFIRQHFLHTGKLIVIFDSKTNEMVAFAGVKTVDYEYDGQIKQYLMIEVAMVVPEHQGKRLSGIAVKRLINDALIERNLNPIYIALRTQNPNVVEAFSSNMGTDCFPNPFHPNLNPNEQLLAIARHAAKYTSQGHLFNESTFVVSGVYPPESGLVYGPSEVPWWRGEPTLPFNQFLNKILGYTVRQPAQPANALIFVGKIDPEVIIAYDKKNHELSSWRLRLLRWAKKALNWVSAT